MAFDHFTHVKHNNELQIQKALDHHKQVDFTVTV